MKPEELMIGDWVKFDNLKGGSEFIRVGLRTLFNMTDNEYLCSFIEPIPITSEILEKNGFYNVVPDIFRLPDEAYDIVLMSLYDSHWVLNINTKMCGKGIANLELNLSSIHELQHALRLCNIEKEIEL